MDPQTSCFLQNFGCGVLVIDGGGRLTFANAAARRILDLTEQDAWLPDALFGCGPPLAGDGHPFARVLAGAKVVGEEFQWVRPDGISLVIHINGAPLLDVAGAVQGGIFDINDITPKDRLLQDVRRANARLEKSESRLRAVMSSIDEILFEFDENSTYLHVWAGDEALLAQPAEEMIGRTIAEVAGEALAGISAAVIRRVQQTGEAENFEYPLDVPKGSCWFLARIAPIPGSPGTFIFLARDITERKKMEEDLRRAEEILRRSDQSKTEFISTAAHELRTPLTSILGYADLLLNADGYGGFTAAQQHDFLREIEENAQDLTETVNEMLDISRIESGQPIPLDLRPGELEDVLERARRNFQIQQPRHRFELHLDAPVPPALRIDRHKIVQVMENLLGNAAKFSPAGTLVRITGRAAEGGYVVEVADEGVGMTEEQQAQIFEKFYRADSSDSAASGLGLGMGIVKGIIEAHRGRIWVESALGRGTAVRFFLPLPPPGTSAGQDAG